MNKTLKIWLKLSLSCGLFYIFLTLLMMMTEGTFFYPMLFFLLVFPFIFGVLGYNKFKDTIIPSLVYFIFNTVFLIGVMNWLAKITANDTIFNVKFNVMTVFFCLFVSIIFAFGCCAASNVKYLKDKGKPPKH